MSEAKDLRPHQYKCANCGALNEVSVAFAGREHKCGECGTTSIVPMPRVGLGRRRKITALPASENAAKKERQEPQQSSVQLKPAPKKAGDGEPKRSDRPEANTQADTKKSDTEEVKAACVGTAETEDWSETTPRVELRAPDGGGDPEGGYDIAPKGSVPDSADNELSKGKGRSGAPLWTGAAMLGIVVGAILYLATQTSLVTTLIEPLEEVDFAEPDPVTPDPVTPDPSKDPASTPPQQPTLALDSEIVRGQWSLLLRRFEAADRTLVEIRRLKIDRLEPAFQSDQSFIAGIDRRIRELENDLDGDRRAVFGAMEMLQELRASDPSAFDALAETLSTEYRTAGNHSFADYIGDARKFAPQQDTTGIDAFWQSRFSSN